jgi:putative oxidoreductase
VESKSNVTGSTPAALERVALDPPQCLIELAELVCGALLLLGALTPFAAAGVIAVLTIAWVTNHRAAGFFVFARPTKGWEYLLTLVVVTAVIGVLGPGR